MTAIVPHQSKPSPPPSYSNREAAAWEEGYRTCLLHSQSYQDGHRDGLADAQQAAEAAWDAPPLDPRVSRIAWLNGADVARHEPTLKEKALRLVADYGVANYQFTAAQVATIRAALEAQS